MITSTSNGQIKWVMTLMEKAKFRRKEGKFVAEGMKMFLEAPMDLISEVYISEDFGEGNSDKELARKCKEKLEGFPYEMVTKEVFRKMSDTVTPQGILTVLKCLNTELETMIQKETPTLVLLENIQDPGNLGTILRTAEGAGVDGIILSRDCVDIYNPKVIRSTMGGIYRMPFLYADDLLETIDLLKNKNIPVYAAALEKSQDYDKPDYSKGCAFVIGNEANGLKEETIQKAGCCVRIPMEGAVESLNAGVATSLLVYEAYRQRRNQK